MMCIRTFVINALVVYALCGCSIEFNQYSTVVPPSESTTTPADLDRTVLPAVDVTKIPVTWSDLNLTGRLYFINTNDDNPAFSLKNIQVLDLVRGEISTLFSANRGAWIFYLDISPDGKQAVISYIDPSNPTASSNRALYIVPLGTDSPYQLLLQPPTENEHYTQAEWSPDGDYIYYSHYDSTERPLANLTPDYAIYRMKYPGGTPEKIIDHAFWPRPSSDSTQLVYVALDPESGANSLSIANADGSDPRQIALSGVGDSVIFDSPVFLPDGQSILFSMSNDAESYQPNWWDKLMGVQIVKAHSVPSDWWSVPITGGVPNQLTQLNAENLFADNSPDKKHVVSVSEGDLFIMELDGSNLNLLLSDPGIYGTVSWMP